jgi:hypothetical protein
MCSTLEIEMYKLTRLEIVDWNLVTHGSRSFRHRLKNTESLEIVSVIIRDDLGNEYIFSNSQFEQVRVYIGKLAFTVSRDSKSFLDSQKFISSDCIRGEVLLRRKAGVC